MNLRAFVTNKLNNKASTCATNWHPTHAWTTIPQGAQVWQVQQYQWVQHVPKTFTTFKPREALKAFKPCRVQSNQQKQQDLKASSASNTWQVQQDLLGFEGTTGPTSVVATVTLNSYRNDALTVCDSVAQRLQYFKTTVVTLVKNKYRDVSTWSYGNNFTGIGSNMLVELTGATTSTLEAWVNPTQVAGTNHCILTGRGTTNNTSSFAVGEGRAGSITHSWRLWTYAE